MFVAVSHPSSRCFSVESIRWRHRERGVGCVHGACSMGRSHAVHVPPSMEVLEAGSRPAILLYWRTTDRRVLIQQYWTGLPIE